MEKPKLVEIELQEGSPFSVEMLEGGGLRVKLPKAAVERALLLHGTSYPVLVANSERLSDEDRVKFFRDMRENLLAPAVWQTLRDTMPAPEPAAEEPAPDKKHTPEPE